MKHLAFGLLTALSTIGIVHAQSITFSGQVRERTEFDSKSFVIGQSSDAYHWLRSRLRGDVGVNTNVNAVIEVQDARQFGQEPTTFNTGAPAFDLRQGYIDAHDLCGGVLAFRLGRQELAYANQRLIGPVEWSNNSQTFDAFRVRGTLDGITIDAFGGAIRRLQNPVPGYARDVILVGSWITWKPVSVKGTLQGFFVYDNPKNGNDQQSRYTTGLYANGSGSGFDAQAEGSYQFGNFRGRTMEISAFMIGFRCGYTMKDLAGLRVGIGIDVLSGTDPTDTTRYGAFNTLYGSNHGKYGHMDYFTNIPLHTSGLGLRDIMVELSCTPFGAFGLNADWHLFSTVSDPSHVSPSQTAYSKNIGMELDVNTTWKIADAIGMQVGYSVFDGERDRFLYTGRKTTQWAFAMATLNF